MAYIWLADDCLWLVYLTRIMLPYVQIKMHNATLEYILLFAVIS